MSTRLQGQAAQLRPDPIERSRMIVAKPTRTRENNFGAIRLFAALLVIYGHGQDMKGAPTPVLWGGPVAGIGLDIFFSLSGYLIYDSWLRDPRLGSFVLKRALRILPGLAVCVLACVFVIGAAATALPLPAYFGHHRTWQFLLNIVLYLRLYLPGVFTHRLLGGAVNGSLWSLFPETLCYLAVPLVWSCAAWGRGALLLAIMGACGGGGLYMFAYHPTGYGLIYSADPKYVLVQVPFFMAGAFWRQVQLRLPPFRLDAAVALTAATFLLPMLIGAGSTPFRWLTLPYVVIAFGSQSTPLLRHATRFGDLSYGAYLYAFPIQQLVLDHVHGFATTIATAATLAVAMLSWHLVERPALRLKPSGGRRPEAELGLASTVADSVRHSLSSRPDWQARRRAALRLLGGTPLLPGIAALLCLAAYAGQLGLGHWQADEYLLFTALRVDGWQALLRRLAASPQPFSEALLALYGAAVLGFGASLVVPFLAALWAGTLGCAVLAARSGLPPSDQRLAVAVVLAGALFAYVLATNDVTEVFYWPATAAAYLPTAGSAVVLLFLLSAPLDARRRRGCGAALLVAAASSEMGAAMAVGFAVAAASASALGGRRRLVEALRDGAWWVSPGLFGGVVLSLAVAHIAGSGVGIGFAPLAVGLRQLVVGMAASDGTDATAAASVVALAAKLLFALGFAAVWQQAKAAGAVLSRWHAALAAALAASALFSVAAAYGHGGTLCCERQATTRFWFMDLLAIMAAAWALTRWPSWRRAAWLPPSLLALSLYPALFNLHGLSRDYANMRWAIASRVQTWRSAAQSGTDQMEFYMPPDEMGMMIRGYAQPIGSFRVGPEAPESVAAIGRFFGKDIVVTCQPWQTRESWLINGRFIPACPPHDGPPDRVFPPPQP